IFGPSESQFRLTMRDVLSDIDDARGRAADWIPRNPWVCAALAAAAAAIAPRSFRRPAPRLSGPPVAAPTQRGQREPLMTDPAATGAERVVPSAHGVERVAEHEVLFRERLRAVGADLAVEVHPPSSGFADHALERPHRIVPTRLEDREPRVVPERRDLVADA